MIDPGLSLDRRTFLAAPASILLAHSGCAAAAVTPLSITEFLTSLDPGAVVDAFARAFARSRSVVVPASVTITGLDRSILVPPGSRLTIAGRLSGRNEAASITLPASGEIIGAGGLLENVSVILQGGSPQIRGLRSTGHFSTAAILLPGPGPYADISITDFDFFDGNFGILRQGANSQLDGAIIRDGRVSRMWGDGIEWNVAPHDDRVMVENIRILGGAWIDPGNRYDRHNWGIGIGFAGRDFINGWPSGQSVRGFTIRNITGIGLRQLVHVENGTDFTIAGIQGQDIGMVVPAGDNIEPAHVACYGSARFSIANVKGTGNARGGGVKLRAGAHAGRYVSPCADFSVSNIQLAHGDLLLEMGNPKSIAKVRSVRLDDGIFQAIGACETMTFSKIIARRARASGPALAFSTLSGDGRQLFAAPRARLTMTDICAVDENGRPSRSIALQGIAEHNLN